MRHGAVVSLALALAVAPLDAVMAQDALTVQVGTRVRVTAPELDLERYDGILDAVRGDTLTVGTVHVPLTSVTRLDVHRGRAGNWRKSAKIGALVGLPAGLALGVVVLKSFLRFGDGSECDGDPCWLLVPSGAVAGGLAGALVGGAVGALTDRWEEVPLERLSVSLTPRRDGGFALGFSVRF